MAAPGLFLASPLRCRDRRTTRAVAAQPDGRAERSPGRCPRPEVDRGGAGRGVTRTRRRWGCAAQGTGVWKWRRRLEGPAGRRGPTPGAVLLTTPRPLAGGCVPLSVSSGRR